jgi:hypothetical protein
MPRKSKNAPVPALVGFSEPERALRKSSHYKPWRPGEIPVGSRGNVGSLTTVSEPHDDAPEMPYGEYMGVHKPANRGRGWPKRDERDHDTHSKTLRSRKS